MGYEVFIRGVISGYVAPHDVDRIAQAIKVQIEPITSLILLEGKGMFQALADSAVYGFALKLMDEYKPLMLNPETIISRRRWGEVFGAGATAGTAKDSGVSHSDIYKAAFIMTKDVTYYRHMQELERKELEVYGVKSRHEGEFLKACADVKPYFDDFKAGVLDIADARGKTIPRERWKRETFVNYCLSKNVGWGREMLRKVYDKLSCLTV